MAVKSLETTELETLLRAVLFGPVHKRIEVLNLFLAANSKDEIQSYTEVGNVHPSDYVAARDAVEDDLSA